MFPLKPFPNSYFLAWFSPSRNKYRNKARGIKSRICSFLFQKLLSVFSPNFLSPTLRKVILPTLGNPHIARRIQFNDISNFGKLVKTRDVRIPSAVGIASGYQVPSFDGIQRGLYGFAAPYPPV